MTLNNRIRKVIKRIRRLEKVIDSTNSPIKYDQAVMKLVDERATLSSMLYLKFFIRK